MASVKTDAGRASGRAGHAMGGGERARGTCDGGGARGASPGMCPEGHGVVAMASVKTGAGRAGAREGHAMGISRGESPEMGAS